MVVSKGNVENITKLLNVLLNKANNGKKLSAKEIDYIEAALSALGSYEKEQEDVQSKETMNDMKKDAQSQFDKDINKANAQAIAGGALTGAGALVRGIANTMALKDDKNTKKAEILASSMDRPGYTALAGKSPARVGAERAVVDEWGKGEFKRRVGDTLGSTAEVFGQLLALAGVKNRMLAMAKQGMPATTLQSTNTAYNLAQKNLGKAIERSAR